MFSCLRLLPSPPAAGYGYRHSYYRRPYRQHYKFYVHKRHYYYDNDYCGRGYYTCFDEGENEVSTLLMSTASCHVSSMRACVPVACMHGTFCGVQVFWTHSLQPCCRHMSGQPPSIPLVLRQSLRCN